MKTIEDLIEYSSIPESLIRAVVEQIGGWEEFTERAPEVAEHGADSGLSGFTLCADTVKFYASNRDGIRALANAQSAGYGDPAIVMVSKFQCLRGESWREYNLDTVGAVLYSPMPPEELLVDVYYVRVANALAWYALEEVSSAYVDMLEA